MPSEKRIEAARSNGAKSYGPRTPEGKAISSRNALRHGMCAKALVLTNEDAEAFEEMHTSYLDEFQPVGASELALLDEMVSARWRQCRGWGVETAMLDLKMDQQESQLEARYQRLDEATRTAIAYTALEDTTHSLDQIQRHDTRLSRMYRLAMKTLVERQDRRKAEAANTNLQNEPKPAADALLPPEENEQFHDASAASVGIREPGPANEPAIGPALESDRSPNGSAKPLPAPPDRSETVIPKVEE